MICNYTNINDFCSNKYLYSFISLTSSGTTVTVDRSETAPVLRIDKDTSESKIITEFSQEPIPTCSIDDDNESTTDWECYLTYRYSYSGVISDPPLETFKNAQIDLINNAYGLTIEDGIAVTINDQNILLGSSINDQIVYKSVLSYAQALYDDDTDAAMPSFNDKNGQIYTLSYNDLITVFKTYLEKIIYYKNLKDTLANTCSRASSINDIQASNWNKNKVIEGLLNSTTITTQIDKPSTSSECIQDSLLLSYYTCNNNTCQSIQFENFTQVLTSGNRIFTSLCQCQSLCSFDGGTIEQYSVARDLGPFGYGCPVPGGADPETIEEKEQRILQTIFVPLYFKQGWSLKSRQQSQNFQFGTPVQDVITYSFACSGTPTQPSVVIEAGSIVYDPLCYSRSNNTPIYILKCNDCS